MTTNDDKILNDPTKQDCQAAFDELQIWVLLTIIVPSIVYVFLNAIKTSNLFLEMSL